MKKKLSEAELARRERRKKIRRKRLAILALVLISIGVIVFVILLKTKLFPIKNVVSKGSKLYTSQEITNASGITDDTPIMSISETKIGQRLFRRLPYIETVKIKRNFPDAVVITVTDAKEFYAFKSGEKYYAVSQKGRVLKKYDELPEGLIEVVSNDTALKVGNDIKFKTDKEKELFDFLTTYPKEKGISVNYINIANSVRITIGVESRFEVNLGSEANLEEKINHLAGMIPQIGDRKGKINLDMWSNSDSKGTFIAEN